MSKDSCEVLTHTKRDRCSTPNSIVTRFLMVYSNRFDGKEKEMWKQAQNAELEICGWETIHQISDRTKHTDTGRMERVRENR